MLLLLLALVAACDQPEDDNSGGEVTSTAAGAPAGGDEIPGVEPPQATPPDEEIPGVQPEPTRSPDESGKTELKAALDAEIAQLREAGDQENIGRLQELYGLPVAEVLPQLRDYEWKSAQAAELYEQAERAAGSN